MSLLLITFILPLIASVATFALGNKMAKVLALLFSAATFVLSIGVYLSEAHSETGSLQFTANWIPEMNIHFSLLVDGLSIWLLLLTNFLVPVLILASYQKSFKNEAALYGSVTYSLRTVTIDSIIPFVRNLQFLPGLPFMPKLSDDSAGLGQSRKCAACIRKCRLPAPALTIFPYAPRKKLIELEDYSEDKQ